MVLAQLWSSTRVFRRPDGAVDGLALRVRSRLSMGIAHDCFWWWREEFQGKANPYKAQSTPGSNGLPDHPGTSFLQLSDVVALPSNSVATPEQEIFNEVDALQDLTGATSLEFPMTDNMAFAI